VPPQESVRFWSNAEQWHDAITLWVDFDLHWRELPAVHNIGSFSLSRFVPMKFRREPERRILDVQDATMPRALGAAGSVEKQRAH
jgi:hypothetical protein